MGKFLKPLATINLPNSPNFLGNYCKGIKIYHFSSEIIIGQLLYTLYTSGHTENEAHDELRHFILFIYLLYTVHEAAAVKFTMSLLNTLNAL